MSVIDKLASSLGVGNEIPNQELAQDILESEDTGAIEELVSLLLVHSKDINNDSIKTLYEIAFVKPDLIRDYSKELLYHLNSENNRMVWGAMTALAAISRSTPDSLYPHVDEILSVMEKGSVITRDAGIRVLSGIASADKSYREIICPHLIAQLLTCRPKDLAQYSEQIAQALDESRFEEFRQALEARLDELTSSQRVRVERVLKQLH